MIETLIVLAKQPVPGRVKTRLMSAFSATESAALAASALSDTLDAADQVSAARRVLAFEGDPTGWLRPDWTVVRQGPGGLDARLCAAFDNAAGGSALLIGMDTPHLRAAQMNVFDPEGYDCCLGLTLDGGYWTIGFADSRMGRRAIQGIPMSTDQTARHQLQRLYSLGLRVQLLDTVMDVDTPADAEQVARLQPDNRFAAKYAELVPLVPAAVGSLA